MTKLKQTKTERTKSEVLIKIANMLMELDNDDFIRVHSTCKDIQKLVEQYESDHTLLSYALRRSREE